MIFPTDYETILARVEAIDPIAYGKTRNYIDGAVTKLSPYISRGVISTNTVLQSLLARGYKIHQMESMVKELCWRDYFQRVWQHKNIETDLRQLQKGYETDLLPKVVVQGTTGIKGIDLFIEEWYATGYMHNHCRMYTAMLTCNVGKTHWKKGAEWMYYHLLDGDLASNHCSWQWVAGANSSKKYYANQENISKFTKTSQRHTFLDVDYSQLEEMGIPEVLRERTTLNLLLSLPSSDPDFYIDPTKPTLVYNYYNLDPEWKKDWDANRVLLLEPEIFERYPVSPLCINFALELSKSIKNLKVSTASFRELQGMTKGNLYYKEHPLNAHYQGIEEPRDWIAPGVTSYFPSFFGYWKQVEKYLRKIY